MAGSCCRRDCERDCERGPGYLPSDTASRSVITFGRSERVRRVGPATNASYSVAVSPFLRKLGPKKKPPPFTTVIPPVTLVKAARARLARIPLRRIVLKRNKFFR